VGDVGGRDGAAVAVVVVDSVFFHGWLVRRRTGGWVWLASVGWSKGLDSPGKLAVFVNLYYFRLKRAGGVDQVHGLSFGFFESGGGERGAIKANFVGFHFFGWLLWLADTQTIPDFSRFVNNFFKFRENNFPALRYALKIKRLRRR
jgi:hypothetical protein